MDIEAIAKRMLIVSLRQQAWRVTRINKKETNEVNTKHGTNAAKVVVNLIESDSLKEIYKIQSKIYMTNVKHTLPTIQEGFRLVPASGKLEHAQRMGGLIKEHDDAVEKFLSEYDDEKLKAPIRLKGLFDPSAWPSKEEVRRKFGVHIKFLSCPSEGSWKDWIEETVHVAESEVLDNLKECVKKIADQCQAGGRIFSSNFENLSNAILMAKSFDENLISNLELSLKSLAQEEVEVIREDEGKRSDLVNRANQILNVFGNL